MNNLNISFALGFMIGSMFNLFVLWWFSNKIYTPKNNENTNQNLLKEVEKIVNQKDKQVKDLSLTIKNLHINPQEKEKNVVDPNPSKEENHHFSLMNHDQQDY